MNHLLHVPHVVTTIGKRETVGNGKKRAWCWRCHRLHDRTTFHRVVWCSHPSSETGLYYEPWVEYVCEACSKKLRQTHFMPEREYRIRLRKTLRGLK